MAKMIKDYKINKILGKGTYALAYLVEKTESDITKNYVIKQISLEGISPLEKEEIKKEAKLLSQIKSNFVVKFYDSFEENNQLNIVMEYCEGGDLDKLLNQRNKIPLNDNFIWKLFIQIVIGLAELHDMKILHRDLKTSNIFLTKNYDIKIGDLGVAKKLSENNFAKTVIGTPYYLSPEICKEKPYNEKSDIWALGCILYELCTFKHPFEATNQAALINKILKENPKPIPYTFDYYFNEIIKKLLQKNMNKRPSCKIILKDMYVMRKAKELKLYHKYEKLIDYKKSSSKTRNNKRNLKIGLDEDTKHNEKKTFFTISNDSHLNIKTRPRSFSKNKKVEQNMLNESKKNRHKKNGIPFSKKNPFVNEKENKIILKQIKPEIMKSNSRRSSKKKSIKKEKVSINDKIITQENKLRNISLLDTLEMNKNRFNKVDKKIENDFSSFDKENHDINSLKNKISTNNIIINADKFRAHTNIYNNYDLPKLSSPDTGKYSLNEMIDDFQSPKQNNNLSNNKVNLVESNTKRKNEKNAGFRTSNFHIYYNKNNQNNEKGDNYLSESDEENNSNKKEFKNDEEKSDNDNEVEEEKVKTIFTPIYDTCSKIKENVNENIILLIEKTKQDLFELLGDKDYKK
jgi:NIMA (never in mitosis gene a)-related kinase